MLSNVKISFFTMKSDVVPPFAESHLGYMLTVCPCLTKGTPGLNELKAANRLTKGLRNLYGVKRLRKCFHGYTSNVSFTFMVYLDKIMT